MFSHIRIADRPADLHAVRIATGEANAVIGGDLVVTASVDALAKMAVGTTHGVVNCFETPTSEFTRNPDWAFPQDKMQAAIVEAVGTRSFDFFDAGSLATKLLGDAIATNLFLLGYAWQKGWVPVSEASLDKAIELNGAAVEMNRQALLWGRRAAVDLAAVQRAVSPAPVIRLRPESLEHVLNDVHGIGQVGQHETGEGQIVQSGQGFGQPLVIAGQATEPGSPAEAALDHPAPG